MDERSTDLQAVLNDLESETFEICDLDLSVELAYTASCTATSCSTSCWSCNVG